jgi:hypothetical protein
LAADWSMSRGSGDAPGYGEVDRGEGEDWGSPEGAELTEELAALRRFDEQSHRFGGVLHERKKGGRGRSSWGIYGWPIACSRG